MFLNAEPQCFKAAQHSAGWTRGQKLNTSKLVAFFNTVMSCCSYRDMRALSACHPHAPQKGCRPWQGIVQNMHKVGHFGVGREEKVTHLLKQIWVLRRPHKRNTVGCAGLSHVFSTLITQVMLSTGYIRWREHPMGNIGSWLL